MLADSVRVKQPKRCGAQGRLMRFLFRIAFWLTLVGLVLPSAGSHTNSLLSAGEAMSAAKATVTDAGSFCDRQPEACTIGSQAAVAIGHRAQAGIKMMYDYLTEHLGAEDGAAAAGAGPGKPPAQSSRALRDTLVPADLVPPWRGPRPRKEARPDRPQ